MTGGGYTLAVFRRFTLAAVALSMISACSSPDSTPTVLAAPPPTIAVPDTTATTIAATTTTSTASATTTTVPVVPGAPLDGLPVEDSSLVERRVLAVKIDNHWDARPQSGIEEADAVYELPVESGLTRFIALFHRNDSTYLGPMRSGRPTDPTLLKPLGATFVISGAQDWVINRITSAGVSIIGEVRPETFRISNRAAPHNLYVDTAALREHADANGYSNEPPPDLFAWAGWEDVSTEGATSIRFDWSPGQQVRWDWTGDEYLRFIGGEPHETMTGEGERSQIQTDALVVLFATRYTASPSGAGSSVPAMDTVGSGRALIFGGGRMRAGSWSRSSIEEPFALATADGEELTVPPGRPWISVFPDNRSIGWESDE
jgi:hypothetical protein